MAPPCRMASRLGHSRLISMVIVFRGAGGRALQRAVTSLTVLGVAASPTLVGVAASQKQRAVDPGTWIQSLVPQLQCHAIRQFLKLAIREPIRFRFVVQRNLERFETSAT